MKKGVGITIILIIALVVYIKVLPKSDISDESIIGVITRIPEFHIRDVNEKDITNINLLNMVAYFQFFDPRNESEIELLNRVNQEWFDSNLIILAFPLQFDKKVFDMVSLLERIILIKPEYYNEMRRKLYSPSCCSGYYLFNMEGNLVLRGLSMSRYEDALKAQLAKLLLNKSFELDTFIRVDTYVNEITWFRQIDKFRTENPQQYLGIGLFTKVCDICTSGRLITRLDQLNNDINVRTIALFPQRYSPNDLIVLKNQLSLNLNIAIADNQLNSRWEDLINEFGEVELSDILFLIDDKGKIVKLYNNNCNCENAFFEAIKCDKSGF